MTEGMSYQDHLSAALAAFFEAYPDVSPRALSLKAGVSRGWVSEFMSSGTANFGRASRVFQAMLDHADEVGDADRAARFRAVAGRPLIAAEPAPQTERGAA